MIGDVFHHLTLMSWPMSSVKSPWEMGKLTFLSCHRIDLYEYEFSQSLDLADPPLVLQLSNHTTSIGPDRCVNPLDPLTWSLIIFHSSSWQPQDHHTVITYQRLDLIEAYLQYISQQSLVFPSLCLFEDLHSEVSTVWTALKNVTHQSSSVLTHKEQLVQLCNSLSSHLDDEKSSQLPVNSSVRYDTCKWLLAVITVSTQSFSSTSFQSNYQ